MMTYRYESLRPSCRLLRTALCTAFAFSAASAFSSAAEAHGRNAVPADPALRDQYEVGLAAYYNRDYAAALNAWRPLAQRKSENSAPQTFLGFMYATGQGVEQDPAAAAEWYRRAAMQDDMLAQVRLALLYRSGGEGAAQDHVQAFLWASLAARQESHLQTVAVELRDALAKEMTPQQIAEARSLTAAWIEQHSKAE
jgi:TPR repeat protein